MNEILNNTLLAIGTALLGLLSAYILYLISALTQKIKVQTSTLKDQKQKVLVNNAVDRIDDLTKKSVVATQETAANALKELVADGKVEKSELVALSGQVADKVVAQVTPELKALAGTEIVDIKKYVLDIIENEIKKLKEVNVVPVAVSVEAIQPSNVVDNVISSPIQELSTVTPEITFGIIPEKEIDPEN